MELLYSVEVEIPELLEDTNENTYEIWWAVREGLFTEILGHNPQSIFEAFAQFDSFEKKHTLSAEKILTTKEGEETEKWYLNGKVNVLSDPQIPDAPLTYNLDTRLAAVKMFCHPEIETVIELGCGYGRRLIELFIILQRPDIHFIGTEYTSSGRRIFNMLSQHFFPTLHFSDDFVDHKLCNFPFIDPDKNTLVFSCHSLEQVAQLPLDYFVKLAQSCRAISGVHIEPFGFQAVSEDQKNNDQKAHERETTEKGYNTNMIECLKYAENLGVLEIIHIEVDFNEEQKNNPSSWVAWKKK